MPVQASACARRNGNVDAVDVSKRINRNAGAECDATVIAARTKRRDNVLRAVINSVRIRMHGGRGGSILSAADGLVIHSRRLAGALRGRPIIAVIVSEREL